MCYDKKKKGVFQNQRLGVCTHVPFFVPQSQCVKTPPLDIKNFNLRASTHNFKLNRKGPMKTP